MAKRYVPEDLTNEQIARLEQLDAQVTELAAHAGSDDSAARTKFLGAFNDRARAYSEAVPALLAEVKRRRAER